jgi:glutaredoxin
MKKLLIILILVIGGYQAWNTLKHKSSFVEPLYDESYVVVYGRNSCGYTHKMIKDLERAGIPYEYEIVDEKEVSDVLHKRMNDSSIDTRRYYLPVVDVNGHLTVRPKSSEVIQNYEASSL